MSITDQLLAALSQYGLPMLFGVTAIAAVGVPLPISLMLVAAGSFVELGEMKLWQVIVVKFFSDRIQALVEVLGNLGWVIVGLIATLILSLQLLRYLRPRKASSDEKLSNA